MRDAEGVSQFPGDYIGGTTKSVLRFYLGVVLILSYSASDNILPSAVSIPGCFSVSMVSSCMASFCEASLVMQVLWFDKIATFKRIFKQDVVSC